MTWKSAVMPDDALTDCLVGTMLQGTTDKSSAVELSGNPGELPLWQVMRAAFDQCWTGKAGYAAEIEALRDHVLPPEPEPFTPALPVDKRWGSLLWCAYNERQRLRVLLTEQAQIAKGKQ